MRKPSLIPILLGLFATTLAAQTAAAPAEETKTAEAGFASFAEPAAEKAALSWHGLFSSSARAYFNWSDPAGTPLGLPTRFDLELKHAVKRNEFLARLHFSRDLSTSATAPEIDKFLRDMVDEAYARLFFDGFDVEAGLLKLIWGKGDDMHVIDVLNPIDYSDFVNNDYLERKTAELMLKANLRLTDFAALELVWQPVFNQDIFPQTGRWAPYRVEALNRILQQAGVTTIINEDTSGLKNGSYAARFIGSFGPLDLGLAYAYTYFREPAVDPRFATSTQKFYITNNRVHLIGLEAGGAVGGFNLRSEAGLFLTEDLKGDDPRVKNPRAGWLAGFDKNLPLSNLNLNIQARGQYVLFNDKISSNPALADTDYSSDSIYSDQVLAVALSDAWANEKFKPKLAWTFNFERQDWMLRPELNILPFDDVSIRLRYTQFYGSDKGSFGHYWAGSFAELCLSYHY
jgi:hypothetical protein